MVELRLKLIDWDSALHSDACTVGAGARGACLVEEVGIVCCGLLSKHVQN